MSNGFFVTGTDTGVGKTTITAAISSLIKDKVPALAAYKPVQTGVTGLNCGTFNEDVYFIKYYGGLDCRPNEMNTYTFPEPVSPHLAAELAGVSIDISRILADYEWLQGKYGWVLVEGAGGLGVPLNRNGFLMADLACALKLPLIIVTGRAVGTINHTLLTVRFAQSLNMDIKGIIINDVVEQTGPAAEDNPEIITQLTGVPLLGIFPHIGGLTANQINPLHFNQIVKHSLKWGNFLC